MRDTTTGDERSIADRRRATAPATRRRLVHVLGACVTLLVASACLPSRMPAHIGYAGTQNCIDHTASPLLCAAGEDLELDVISDDRSEGIIVLRQDTDGVDYELRVWAGTSFRLMGHQRPDGSCRDLIVNGTRTAGAPFLLSCVWGPFTSPPDTYIRLAFPRPT